MKKFVSIIAILLMLSLAACSNQDTPSAADNPSNTQTESNTMLDAGVWPVNEYTEGLPVPSGTVGWAMLDFRPTAVICTSTMNLLPMRLPPCRSKNKAF